MTKAKVKSAEVKLDDTTKSIISELTTEGKLFPFSEGAIETKKKDVVDLFDLNIQERLKEKDEDAPNRVYQAQDSSSTVYN